MGIKICLDAGHYGKRNQSPVVKEYWESEMTWELHLLLKAALEERGFEVVTTRAEQTKDLAVFDRGRTAKGCDMFISLHSNACDSESVDRVSTFYAFDNLNDGKTLAQRFANEIAEVMNVSYGKAATRESEVNPGQEYYGVMRGARSVGCPLYFIIEHSFHTNKNAANWLLKAENLEELAELEATIIGEYFNLEKPKEPGEPKEDCDFEIFDKVKIRDGVSTWYNGKSMAKWVPKTVFYIRKMTTDGKITISTDKEGAITGTVWESDIEFISRDEVIFVEIREEDDRVDSDNDVQAEEAPTEPIAEPEETVSVAQETTEPIATEEIKEEMQLVSGEKEETQAVAEGDDSKTAIIKLLEVILDFIKKLFNIK